MNDSTETEEAIIEVAPQWSIKDYRLWFKSEPDEANLPHVHIANDRGMAKFELNPVELIKNFGYSVYELNKAKKVVTDNEDWLLKKWQEHFRPLLGQ